MRQLVGLVKNKIVGPETITSNTRPALATDGIDITSWHEPSDSFSFPQFQVFLDCTTASSLTAPTSGTGVELWGYLASRASWYFIQNLHAGATIPIVGAGQGYSEFVTDVGDFDRLAVAATISAGTLTASFGPLETWTY